MYWYCAAATTERILCDHQPQPLHLGRVGAAAFRRVNSRGVDAGMAQDVRESAQILLRGIKCSCEQMPQIVGEDLLLGHPGAVAQGLHIPPNIASVQRPPRPGDENRPGGSFLPLGIFF